MEGKEGDVDWKMLKVHHQVLSQRREAQRMERMRLFVKSRQQQQPSLAKETRDLPIQLMTNDERRRSEVNLGVVPRQKTELVPIRLDVDMDGYKLRDTFSWNLHEEAISCEEFAELTCRDFDLPTTTLAPVIAKSMREQLQEHREATSMLRNAGGIASLAGVRVLLRLDVTIGTLQLIDQLEWDLGEERNSPAAFAAQYVRELALPSEFVTTIANDLLEQICHLRRAILLVGFSRDKEGNVRVNDGELQSFVLPPAKAGHLRRDPHNLAIFTPLIAELDPLEIEKIELSRDREARRKRRQVRGGRRVAAPGEFSLAAWTHPEAPKSIPTPLSYRGSLHRILNKIEDDDPADGPSSAPPSRSTRSRRGRRS